MEMSLDQQMPPDVAASPGTSNDLVKLIRKLRWIGMEEEAERLLNELTHRNIVAADSVLAAPRDTD